MADNWSQNKILSLIKAYKNQECLWNTSDIHYTDKLKKEAAWETLAETVGLDIRTVEKKIKVIRTQFLKYSRVANERNSLTHIGVGNYEPKWFAFKELKFLENQNEPKKSEKRIRPFGTKSVSLNFS